MNETLNTIFNRRSIRTYKLEQIKDEELQLILDSGRFAPSGMNNQSWHFTVVQNKAILNKINEVIRNSLLKSGIKAMEERAKSESFTAFYNAPTLIIVSGDEKAITPQSDCALALGNMFLAAESLSVGSCWIHALTSFFDTEDSKALKKDLGIPEGYVIFGSGAFGYNSGKTPSPAPRKEGTVNIIK